MGRYFAFVFLNTAVELFELTLTPNAGGELAARMGNQCYFRLRFPGGMPIEALRCREPHFYRGSLQCRGTVGHSILPPS